MASGWPVANIKTNTCNNLPTYGNRLGLPAASRDATDRIGRNMQRITRAIAIVVTMVVLLLALPLLGERLLVSKEIGFRTQFISFQLKDADGRRHLGFLCAGRA
eukprot:TRINITY_DN65560_c0_g1_i1.p2 TRINITY_DN65560_c0_g1~~TRINITY_DN65560_c0_g1_i1.p2  ORF type:complete len:104 (-),score=0.49 TRINITY_DN65560_c0_g1_i1:1-312(-)